MHVRIVEVLTHFDAQRAELRDAFDAVPVNVRHLQPTPDSWSVLGVVEHLATAETAIAGVLRKRISEARAAGVGMETETSSVVDRVHIARIVDRQRRHVTSTSLVPKANYDSAEAWHALEAARDAVRAVIVDADGLALGQISAPHPVFGVFNVYEWIVFLGSHESRHAAQIRDIARALQLGGA